MSKNILMALLCASAIPAYAQTPLPDTTTAAVDLDQYVISANKFGENKKNVAQSINVINQKEIEWTMPQNTGTLLEQTGNVFVQRSQLGGGSPVLRGFEASRVLLVIDGVRMNNAIYRAGHLQNAITVDANLLERAEVLYGPASTLYGSDALGGVIVFNSKKPMLGTNGETAISANAMARYSSAWQEGTGHADFNIGLGKVAFLTSATYSNFGDLRSGSNYNPAYGDFGKRLEYVERVNGVDSIIRNADPNTQKFSGYNQVDLMEKILFQQSNKISHTLNLQYSTSSNIPRYDRLTDYRNGALRYAEWYYGPQERLMAAYGFDAANLNGFFDAIKAGVNYQDIEESRYQRNRGNNSLQERIEDVGVIGWNIDARHNGRRHEINIGTDGQHNKVTSTANARDIVTGENSALDTRYPGGGSTMTYAAVYAQHFFKIIPNKLILNDGVRLSYTNLNAIFTDKTFFPFPYSTAEQSNVAWSGNLGLVYLPANRWRIALSGSTGFRAPNVDDLAKVFESAGGEQLVVPNPDLKPEYTYNADLGVTYSANDIIKVEATGFYTWFRDALVYDAFTLNGASSIEYDGQLTPIVALQNKASAYIYGFNAAMTAKLMPDVTLYGTVNHTFGHYKDDVTNTEAPLDHIPPVFGKVSLRYNPRSFMLEGYTLYNGWKRIEDYNPFGEDNQQYATPFGMPGWFTLNVRAGYTFRKYISVEAALENILDRHYRAFASGISAPGRNFVITVRGRF